MSKASAHEKEDEAKKELAKECQIFSIFGTKRECKHCLWQRLNMCQKGVAASVP